MLELITIIVALIVLSLTILYYRTKISAIRTVDKSIANLRYYEGHTKGWTAGVSFGSNIREADEIMKKWEIEVPNVEGWNEFLEEGK